MTTTRPAARPARRRGMRLPHHELEDARMSAIVATGYGSPDVLQLTALKNRCPRPTKCWSACARPPSTSGTRACAALPFRPCSGCPRD